MHKGKVTDIEEILHHARSGGLKLVGTAEDLAIGTIIPFVKGWDLISRLAQAHPDHIVGDRRPVSEGARFGRRLLFRVRRNPHALTIGVIDPAMIGALQRVVFQHLAQG